MASMILITCPKCKKQLKGPEGFVGKSVRCKSCGHNFVVKAPAPQTPTPAAKKPAPEPSMYEFASDPGQAKKKSAAARPEAKTEPPKPAAAKFAADPGDSLSGNPYQLKEAAELSARCPQCARDFDTPDQRICLHCGYDTHAQKRLTTVKVLGRTKFEIIMWLLPGILCVVTVVICLAFVAFLWFGLDRYDKDGAETWWVFPSEVWGSVVCCFISYYCVRFAIRRLIVHPLPPEKVKY
jgi:DNA-directed RNA polymerase subunit RPC12/RpoP